MLSDPPYRCYNAYLSSSVLAGQQMSISNIQTNATFSDLCLSALMHFPLYFFFVSSLEHKQLPAIFMCHNLLLWNSLTPSCTSSCPRPPLCFLCHANQQCGGRQAQGNDLQQAYWKHRWGFQPRYRPLPLPHPRHLLFFFLCGEVSEKNAFCHTCEKWAGGAGYSVWWLPQERKESSKPKCNDPFERKRHGVVAPTAESSVRFVQ